MRPTSRSWDSKIDDLDVRFDDGVATVPARLPDQATREKAILAIGNTEGVERVEDDIEVPDPAGESKMHAVVTGRHAVGTRRDLSGSRPQVSGDFRRQPPNAL